METAVLSAVLRTLGPKLYAFLREGHDLLRRDLKRDVHYIRNKLGMIAAAIEEHDRRSPLAGDVQSAWIHGVRELAHDMEDCIDRFTHRVTGHGALGSMGTRAKFAAVIQELRKKSEELSRLRASYSTAGGGESSSWGPTTPASTFSASEAHTLASDIVGMDGPRGELLELIWETQGQPNQLKVISIVGFGGLGKSLLARQIYESDAVAAQFHPRVWVRAAGKSHPEDVLVEMLQQLGIPGHHRADYCDVNQLVVNLRTCL
ncbi:hypothetical protein E2562_003213 [Oryza meyeriana var. granulata]|uniref:Rx N-terminal domain-containing protein n=1 Tax=Oryza meyeriana var. granulata TaxID=110450 RepID=A0A6G1EUW3_9ORYZ|nr:hypothetical protein E2562_003213 [Oryza meyeriana var. granulata]